MWTRAELTPCECTATGEAAESIFSRRNRVTLSKKNGRGRIFFPLSHLQPHLSSRAKESMKVETIETCSTKLNLSPSGRVRRIFGLHFPKNKEQYAPDCRRPVRQPSLHFPSATR